MGYATIGTLDPLYPTIIYLNPITWVTGPGGSFSGGTICHGTCPPKGPQGPQGPKNAIVATSQGYNELACLESPEVIFLDVKKFKHVGTVSSFDVDPMFVEVCEPDSIIATSAVADIPVSVGVSKLPQNRFMVITSETCTANVNIVLMGTRKGFGGRRFAKKTRAEYERNTRFWNSV
jgi:hypothetical protein